MSSSEQRITGYGVGAPSIKLNPPAIISTRAPTVNDVRYPLMQEWLNTSTTISYQLLSVAAGVATWGVSSFIPGTTASGTTAATLNARSGQVTITTPSIAAGASFTFTITNSTISSATTQVLYALSGGTAGSALTIESITNSAGSSAVVITNGTGATTNAASLALTYLVLN